MIEADNKHKANCPRNNRLASPEPGAGIPIDFKASALGLRVPITSTEAKRFSLQYQGITCNWATAWSSTGMKIKTLSKPQRYLLSHVYINHLYHMIIVHYLGNNKWKGVGVSVGFNKPHSI